MQIQVNRSDDKGRSINSTVQSLLPDNKCVSKTKDEPINSSLQDSLIGSFKGFSIVPISGNVTSVTNTKPAPTRLAPAPTPTHPVPAAVIKPTRVAPSLPYAIVPPLRNGTEVSKSVPPTLPPPNPHPSRPLISSPVLDDTTSSTVKKLINELPVKHPVPSVPTIKPTNTSTSSKPTVSADYSTSAKSNVKQQNAALNRIASLISKSHPTRTGEDRKDAATVSHKATKIDRDTLKTLKISDPIPLSEPSIPVESLPLSKEQEKSAIMRTHSLRHAGHKHKPTGVQSFGSMRLPSSRRPTSVTSCSRPTSPPPPCPPTATGAAKTEESPLQTDYEDNIYAVIEEIPVAGRDNKSGGADNSPPRCRVLDDDNGLLNEIVNEIQARNVDSIYSGDNGVKSENNETSYANIPGPSDAVAASSSRNSGKDLASRTAPANQEQVYENTPSRNVAKFGSDFTSSSDYLRPIKSNGGKLGPKVDSQTSKLQVPEKSAPTYKPFSSPRKPITPITSLHAKNNPSTERRGDESSNSSQKSSDSPPGRSSSASSVSSVVSKFNTANVLAKGQSNTKTDSKAKPAIKAKTSIFEKSSSNSEEEKGLGATSPEDKKGRKVSNVASIQKKFLDQSSGESSGVSKQTKFAGSRR